MKVLLLIPAAAILAVLGYLIETVLVAVRHRKKSNRREPVMAKEIVQWCDVCMESDERVPAREQKVGLADRWLTTDLCDPHYKQYVAPLKELLDEHGTPVALAGVGRPVTRSGGPGNPQASGIRKGRIPLGPTVQCFYCPATYSLKGSGSGLSRHLRIVHGFEHRTAVSGTRCPVCGSQCESIGGVSTHVGRKHAEYGFRNVEEAIWWASENGDPQGVYAEVMNRQPTLDPETEWEAQRARESGWAGSRQEETLELAVDSAPSKRAPAKKTAKKTAGKGGA